MAASATAASSVSIAAVGDLDLGNTPVLPPDPAGYLSPVRQALAAPIVFGNLEGTLTGATSAKCPPPPPKPTATSTSTPTPSHTSTPTPSPTGTSPKASPSTPPPPVCYAFRTPPSYASILRSAGFTVLNSANNHSHDFGPRGVADTTAVLRAAGIVQTGLPGQIGVVDEGGTRVAFVGFAPYSTTNDLLDQATADRLIAKAKQDADLVVVYMHTGTAGSAAGHVDGQEEHYLGEDRGNPQVFAHAAIDAGADLVLASGPHVLRGMEYYRGHLVAYSLGDFAGYHNFATTGMLGLSAVLHVTLDRNGHVLAAHFVSLALNPLGRPAVDPSARAAGFVNALSAADFGSAAAIVEPGGNLSLPRG